MLCYYPLAFGTLRHRALPKESDMVQVGWLVGWLAGWLAGWLEGGTCDLEAFLWLEVDSSVSKWGAQNPLIWVPKSIKMGPKIYEVGV